MFVLNVFEDCILCFIYIWVQHHSTEKMFVENFDLYGDSCATLWILLGDFNNIMSSDEETGRLKVKNFETQDFVDCVSHLDLLDLHFVGCFYTWISPRACSKLDRVLVNPTWTTLKLDD